MTQQTINRLSCLALAAVEALWLWLAWQTIKLSVGWLLKQGVI